MGVKLVILLLSATIGTFSDAHYNRASVAYNPYYSVSGYPIETQEEYEYYEQHYGHAPIIAPYHVSQQNQAPLAAYNARIVSSADYPSAASVISTAQVTNVPVQTAQPAVVSTTPVPFSELNTAYKLQKADVAPLVSSQVTPILSTSNQNGLSYLYAGIAPASYDAGALAVSSGINNINSQSVVYPTTGTAIAYSKTETPFVANNLVKPNHVTGNLPAFVVSRSNVFSAPYPSYVDSSFVPASNSYNLGFNHGINYNYASDISKSNIPASVAHTANPINFLSTPSPLIQNLYVPSIKNQGLNNGNLYLSSLTKSSIASQSESGAISGSSISTPSNPVDQKVVSPINSVPALPNTYHSQPISVAQAASAIPISSGFDSSLGGVQSILTNVSPRGPVNVISYSTTTPSPFNGFVPVSSTYSSIKKHTVYAAGNTVVQPSIYHGGSINPDTYTAHSNGFLQNKNTLPAQYQISKVRPYASASLSTISPLVSHNGSPIPIIYSTTPAPIITTIPVPTTFTQENFSQVTTTSEPIVVTTQKPPSTIVYTTNQSLKSNSSPSTIQSNSYASVTESQSTTKKLPPTVENTVSSISISTIRPTSQVSKLASSAFVTKPSTSLVSGSSTTQSTLVKNQSNIKTSYNTQPGFSTTINLNSEKSTVGYESGNKQDATASTLSGLSIPTTYKTPATNYYGSSTIYNKGSQSTYTTPNPYSTASYSTSNINLSTPKPTVSYNSVSRQDGFTAALSGLANPTTYKSPVTKYASSTTTFNKGSQSTYTTPSSYSITTNLNKQTPTASSYSSISNQNAFASTINELSKPTTYKTPATNYFGSSTIYNKGSQSIYTTPNPYSTASYSTSNINLSTPKPTVTYNSVNRQDGFNAALSGLANPTTYKPPAIKYASSSTTFNKGSQSTYTTPSSYSITTNLNKQTPTASSYSSISNENAFSSTLSGLSKPTTYKTPATNYFGSSTIYNKGSQSIYTTPNPYSTASYSTSNINLSTPKPTVSYNSVNRQDGFNAALSGLANPTTYKPPAIKYASSSTTFNKGSQSTYTTPSSYSITTNLNKQTPTASSYSSISNENAFSSTLSGLSKPTTYKTPVTNYYGSSTIYNKGSQSTYTTPNPYSTASYSTSNINLVTPNPTVSYNSVSRQDGFTAALSGLANPTTYKPPVTKYASSATTFNKGSQSTYNTPSSYSITTTYKPPVVKYASSSTTFKKGSQSTYTTPSSYSITTNLNKQTPTASSYSNVINQNAFASTLSGLSKPNTYKTPVSNYFGSSTIYNKGSQSTYTTPAPYLTASYSTSNINLSTQKPIVSYNKQNAFAAALSGFSKSATYKPSTTNYFSSSSIFNKGSQSTYKTPSSYTNTYSSPSSSIFTTQKSVPQLYNNFLKTTTLPNSLNKFGGQSSYSSATVYGTKPNSSTFNSQASSKSIFSKPFFSGTNYAKNTVNSFANKASVYQSFGTKSKYTPATSFINQPSNQFIPFVENVNIPLSKGYTSSTFSSVPVVKKEFQKVFSNYQPGPNIIVQQPIPTTTIVPSTLEYSSSFVGQPVAPEAQSNFVHAESYLPPVVPIVSDVGSNGIVKLVTDSDYTVTLTPPPVVSTTPRTLPLSYASPSVTLNSVPFRSQSTIKPVVYSTTPVITKVDSSPTLVPVTEFVNPLVN